MRIIRFILAVLIPVIATAQKKNNDIEITGKITGKIPDIIEYTLPINGIDYFGFTNSVQIDPLGNFKIKINLEKTSFIDLANQYKSYGTIIAEPGMQYTININTEVSANSFSVESKNKKGQELYNQIVNRSMIAGGHFETETKDYRKDSLAFEVKQKVEKRRISEIGGFEKLLHNKIISKSFFDLVKTDRDYFHKGILGSLAFINYLSSKQNKNSLPASEYKKLWEEIFKSNPVTNPALLSSPWFYFYTENYLRYNELILDSTDTATLSEFHKKGLIHTHNIDYAKKHLSGLQLEYYFAAYLYYEAMNKNYEKELIALFEQFKKEYPQSSYTTFIEPLIIPIITFHAKQKEPLNPKIQFIDNNSSVNTVKEVLKSLNKKQFYVDVWATWCGPCKSEFKENLKLYSLLASKEITMVYISIDKENRDKQWQEMIHFYNLEGYHIRANEKLYADLLKLYGSQSFGIPWHFLAGNDGDIKQKHVSGPSEIENLEKQLNRN